MPGRISGGLLPAPEAPQPWCRAVKGGGTSPPFRRRQNLLYCAAAATACVSGAGRRQGRERRRCCCCLHNPAHREGAQGGRPRGLGGESARAAAPQCPERWLPGPAGAAGLVWALPVALGLETYWSACPRGCPAGSRARRVLPASPGPVSDVG